jgi:hypothetical protein
MGGLQHATRDLHLTPDSGASSDNDASTEMSSYKNLSKSVDNLTEQFLCNTRHFNIHSNPEWR